MPSRKQRRRRAKDRRHEYEYVYVDEEGREVEAEPDGDSPRKKADRKQQPTTRGGKPIEPPSWTRVAKRGLLFAPLMFITISVLGRNQSTFAHISQTVFLLLFFLPFSYFMDTLIYRSHRRRMAARSAGRKR
ncbi:MAG: hypothetical protein E6G45_07730 [Actinobacteria bacterium]|nr:MAG: hypothetical protein E6G45_07730 [Actinomycetota bacterium]